MKKIIVLLFLTLSCISYKAAFAENRHALIIGNANYEYNNQFGKLPNDINDAEDMANILDQYGFQVTKKLDVKKADMDNILSNFTRNLTQDSVVLFYYSGHGIEFEKKPYIVPIDANIEKLSQTHEQTVGVEKIIATLSNGKPKLKIAILDACRGAIEGKVSKGIGNGFDGAKLTGFSPMEVVAEGTVTVSATASGTTASAGENNSRNSVYTESFLASLHEKPEENFLSLFANVGDLVRNKTKNEQVPWMTSNISSGQFRFSKPTTGVVHSESIPIQALKIPEETPKIGIVSLAIDKTGYKIGENMEIKFSVNKPMFVYIIDVNPKGHIDYLFPNQYQPTGLSTPGITYKIPSFDVDLVIGGPIGVDKVHVIASATPISIKQDIILTALGDLSPETIAKYPVHFSTQYAIKAK